MMKMSRMAIPFSIAFLLLLGALGLMVMTRAQSNPAQVENSNARISPGFLPDPLLLTFVSGGNVRASERFGATCSGFISDRPDHVLTLEANFDFLRISVDSDVDTTLVVIAAQEGAEPWCDDDSNGIHPEIARGFWPAGDYFIYVGSYMREQFASYTLAISEFSR